MDANSQEILDRKLANPKQELSTTESIKLIQHCSELGAQNAAPAANREAVTILGDTGTGKSTSINYWVGCRMELIRTPEELEEMGIEEEEELEEVIVVHPDSSQPQAASIGHGMLSHTLVPQIIQDPNHSERVYLDCPGFSDNRGAEINIANAINIRRALQQVRSVKAMFLANYQDLIGRSGPAVQSMESACKQLFGGVDNLRRHQDAVLLGINRAPLQNLNRIREKFTRSASSTMRILSPIVHSCMTHSSAEEETSGPETSSWQRSSRCRLSHNGLPGIYSKRY